MWWTQMSDAVYCDLSSCCSHAHSVVLQMLLFPGHKPAIIESTTAIAEIGCIEPMIIIAAKAL